MSNFKLNNYQVEPKINFPKNSWIDPTKVCAKVQVCSTSIRDWIKNLKMGNITSFVALPPPMVFGKLFILLGSLPSPLMQKSSLFLEFYFFLVLCWHLWAMISISNLRKIEKCLNSRVPTPPFFMKYPIFCLKIIWSLSCYM